MKKRLLGVLLLTASIFVAQAQKIVAYYPYYKSNYTSLDYSKITDIFYGFIGSDARGNLTVGCTRDNFTNPTYLGYMAGGYEEVFQQTEWNGLRDRAIAAGTKVHIAIGGARITGHLAESAKPAYRANLISEIVDFVAGNHTLNNTRITGVDLDWEFPESAEERTNHLALCQELRSALDTRGAIDGVHYDLSIAVGGSTANMPGAGAFASTHDDFFDTDCFQYVDFVNCMNYDLGYISAYSNHSPVEGAEAVVSRYVETGISGYKLPAEKFVLGVPFYGKGGSADGSDGTDWNSFASSAAYNDADGIYGGHVYNSKPMLEEKADLACQKGLAGILIWEIGQDDPTYSLLTAIYDRFQSTCDAFSCQKPDLGSDQSICGSAVALSAGITLESGESIAWYKNGILESGETTTSYSATEAGTYKAVVTTAAGCEKFDEVVISTGGDLTTDVSNLGYICEDYTWADSVDVTVSGGGGFYRLYDAAEGGSLIKTVTGSFEIGILDVAADDQRTFYVEEPPGETGSIGPTGPYTDGTAGWPFKDMNSVVDDGGTLYDQDWTMEFTTYSSLTIQSIDFIFGYDPALGANDNLHVIIYDNLGATVLEKDIALAGVDFSTATAGDQHLNTVTIDIELPTPGSYEMSFKGTNTLIWFENDWFDPAPNPTWPYVGEVSGATVITLDGTGNTDPDYSWDLSGNVVGMYNWVVSTGSGSSACGRVPFTVYHDCEIVSGTEDVEASNLTVYPNPSNGIVNVTFDLATSVETSVELYNSLGAVIATQSKGASVGSQTVTFDTANLAEGVYFVKVKTGNNVTTETVTVVK